MVGLVFIDTLRLTPVQWVAIGLNTAGWVWCFRVTGAGHLPGHIDTDRHFRCWTLTALLTLSGLWIAFWNETTSVDTWLLFEQAEYLSRLEWHEFLEELMHRPYVDKQMPFLTFWFSRMPLFWLHQVVFFPWALLCTGLMWALYGRAAAFLLATPIFSLMIHQPSHDVLLFGMLLIILRLCQLSEVRRHCHNGIRDSANTCQRCALMQRLLCTPGQRCALMQKLLCTPGQNKFCVPEILLAALIYGTTWMIKPLTILTAPFILPQLGITGLLSLLMWGGYVCWSLRWEFGRHQLGFLLQQVMFQSMKTSKRGKMPHVPLPLSAALHRFLRKIRGSLRWRWNHLGHKAIKALPFYLFPAWLRPWNWRGICLAIVIIIGYGNIKYLLLDLLFLFPVCNEGESIIAM